MSIKAHQSITSHTAQQPFAACPLATLTPNRWSHFVSTPISTTRHHHNHPRQPRPRHLFVFGTFTSIVYDNTRRLRRLWARPRVEHMDPAAVFQQAVGSVMPTRGPPYFYHPHPAYQPPPPFPHPVQPAAPLRRPPTQHRDDDDGNSHRIAHTLTACCRCRQASTRAPLATNSTRAWC